MLCVHGTVGTVFSRRDSACDILNSKNFQPPTKMITRTLIFFSLAVGPAVRLRLRLSYRYAPSAHFCNYFISISARRKTDAVDCICISRTVRFQS